jgi:RNA methyltransferase, TrmH family
MITLRKLNGLPDRLRRKKTAELLDLFEDQIAKRGTGYQSIYLSRLVNSLTLAAPEEKAVFMNTNTLEKADPQMVRSILGNIKHRLYESIDLPRADWNIKEKNTRNNPVRLIFPFKVFLENIRSPYNLGSIFRTSDAFGVSSLILTPDSPNPEHPRCKRSSMGTWNTVAWRRGSLEDLIEERNVFCLELGGISVYNFDFPPSGIVILGNEEYGISNEAKKLTEKKSGRVTIPMAGYKGSLNVSNAYAVLMSLWFRSTFLPKGIKNCGS